MNATDYIAAVRQIEDNHPEEPLLPALRKGFSPINEIYLKHALKRLPVRKPAVDLSEAKDIDPILRELWAERGRLFRKQAILSNKFHDCKTDQERRANSVDILRVWDDIQTVKARIDHFEEHGQLPVETDRFELPEDAVDILLKLNSIRAMISQTQSRIKKLGQMPNDHPEKKSKIEAAEQKLAELKLYRGYAQTKLKGKDIHSSRLE